LHLGDVGDATSAVTEAAEVHDQVERGGHLLTNGSNRKIEAGHQGHGLDAGQGVARAVRVDSGDRAVVAGVHRLEHVERLARAALTDDDAVGAHAEAVAHEVTDGDLASTFDVRRARFEREHVLLVELQLLRVLDGHDALVRRDERREHVERRGLAGAGTTRDDDVQATDDAGLEEPRGVRVQRAEADEIVDLVRVGGELSDGEVRAADREGMDDRVDAGTVRKAGVDHRRRLVDATTDLAHDLVDDAAEVGLVDE
jgi:hypothetical protein